MAEQSETRRYHSPTRAQRAATTRDAIADAAEALFAEDGYRATTIRAIAERAGVAPQTVYAVFRSKRGILLELVARAKASADIATTYETLMAEVDPSRRIALTVEITERWSRAASDLVELVRVEADVDPEVADAWATIEGDRLRGVRALVADLAARGELRDQLSETDAADLIWTLESTDVYRLLVIERGWSARRYQHHLTALLVTSLLAPVRTSDPRPRKRSEDRGSRT